MTLPIRTIRKAPQIAHPQGPQSYFERGGGATSDSKWGLKYLPTRALIYEAQGFCPFKYMYNNPNNYEYFL